MTKVIYFTVAAVPTSGEQAEIDALTAYPGLTVAVRNLSQIDATDNPEDADYVCSLAGNNFPANYPADPYVRTTAANPPAPALLATQMIIKSGVEFLSPEATGTYTNGYTPTIAAGAISALVGS